MAAKWSTEPHVCKGIENHATLFFMVNMAGGMDRGHMCSMKKTSHNLVAMC